MLVSDKQKLRSMATLARFRSATNMLVSDKHASKYSEAKSDYFRQTLQVKCLVWSLVV